MARTITTKLKEPIKIRFKKLANGSQSIYLDIYKDGKREYEFLKLYLLPELNPRIKAQNATTLAAAEKIKSERIIEITENAAGLKHTSSRSKMLLSDWMQVFYESQKQKGAIDQTDIMQCAHSGELRLLRDLVQTITPLKEKN